MAYLKRQGFQFFTAAELIEHFQQHGTFPKMGIALTLDDGWEDNYQHGFPIMRELGIKATIFVVPSCVGEKSTKALLQGEGPRSHLSRDQIREMARYGFEFGSHSLNHRPLHRLGPSEIKHEVAAAKQQLEDLLQQPCKTFAYPEGYISEPAAQAIKDAGHIAAFSTIYGPAEPLNLFALNRVEILRRDRFTYQFARKVRTLSSN
jgi:peptidoglycan/xylan/chitin deacetylase (PgdA/CDA1 family)